jgi:SAM-dependent methyltransferase
MSMLRCASISRTASEAEELPFRDGTFDGVFSMNLLHLIPDRTRLMEESFRVLRPGGKAAFPLTTPEQLRERFLNRFFPSLPGIEAKRYPSIETLWRELQSAGFHGNDAILVDLGMVHIDHAYVKMLESGVFSGLLLVPADERLAGMTALKTAVARWEANHDFPAERRIRAIVYAHKPLVEVGDARPSPLG